MVIFMFCFMSLIPFGSVCAARSTFKVPDFIPFPHIF